MIRLKQLEEVNNFKVCKGKLLFNSYQSSNLNMLDEGGKINSIDLGVKIKGYHCSEHKTLIVDENNYGYRLESGFFEKIEGKTFDSISSSLELGISSKWINYYPVDLEHSVFHMNSLSTLWKSKSSSLKFDGDLVISEFGSGFSLYDPRNGSRLWSYAMPESKYDWYNPDNVFISECSVPIKAEIKKILGAYNEILWISLNSGRILGLNIHTGDLRLDLAIPNNFYTHFPEEIKNFSLTAGSLIDEDMGVIFGLHLNYYWEVDLADPENKYILYDISEQCDQNLIGGGEITQDLVWKNEEIFFYQWSFAQDPSYVGIFNRNTKEITWTSRELGEEGIFKGVKKIDFTDKRLYVLDRAETLHVFER